MKVVSVSAVGYDWGCGWIVCEGCVNDCIDCWAIVSVLCIGGVGSGECGWGY